MATTETAFDNYALSYDADFTHSSVGALQRNRVWKYLAKNLSPSAQPEILELNCGTGEDALWLSRKGFHITATDLSSEMVGVAREKLRERNADVFQSDIKDVFEKAKGKKFDVIFSNFGGMNCLGPSELSACAAKFSGLLNPGGRMIFVIMSRNCKWEQFYFNRKNDPENAYRRRSKEPVEAEIFGQHFSTWYYSPDELSGLFSNHFSTKACKPIGIALPPSYLDNYFRKRKLRLSMLNAIEKLLGNFTSLSDKADHYIIDFIRK